MRMRIFAVLAVISVFFFLTLTTSCGSGTPAIAVALSQTNPQSLNAGSTLALTVTVQNDSKNGGVGWTLSPASSCGSLSGTSGTSVTYTAPASASLTSSCTATITATSVTDSTKHSSVQVTVNPVKVSLSSTGTQTLGTGATLAVNGTLTYDSGNGGLTWALNPVSGCGTLSASSGASVTYTAPSALSAQCSTQLTATSIDDNTKNASVTLTVNPISVAITQPASAVTKFADQGTVALTATLTNDGANKGLTWSLTGCGTVAPGTGTTAIYTPPNAPAAQCTAQVMATSVTDPGKSATAPTITINPIIAVGFSPAPPASLAEGATQGLTATITNDTGAGLSWSINPATGCGSLSANSGTSVTYNAPLPLAAQCIATVTVSSVADSTKKAQAAIAVNPTTISITAPSSNQNIAAGTAVPFTAAITNDGSGSGIDWTLSPSTGCGTLSATSGASVTYNAPAETSISAACTVNVTAESAVDHSKTATLQVTANPITVSAITSGGGAPPAGVAENSAPVPLAASITWDGSNSGLSWAITSGSSCGTMGAATFSNGTSSTTFIPAASVSSACSAMITVSSVADPNKKSTVTISVNPVTVTISPNIPTQVVEGQTQSLTASVSYDPSNNGVTWSLNPASGCGTLSGQTTTAATYHAPASSPTAACSVIATATSISDNTKSASVTLNIVQPPIQVSITTPGPIAMDASNLLGTSSQALLATIQYDYTNAGIFWSTSNPSCGSLTALTGTSTTFNAASSPLSADCSTIITAGSVADSTKKTTLNITVYRIQVNVSPGGSQNLQPSGTMNFTASVSNDAVPGPGSSTAGVAWSLNPATGCGALSNSTTTGVTYTAPASGPCTVQLIATSNADNATTGTVGISVASSNPPVITTTQQDVPNGLINMPYGTYFSVSGGTGPYTFSVTSGSLPPGLAFSATNSGQLTGTPTTANTYNFTVQVKDSLNATATASFQIIISSAPSGAHNSYLNGKYACLLRGYTDSNGSQWATLSAVNANGSGSITAGVFDYNGSPGAVNGTLTGTYGLGSDNRGILTITLAVGGVTQNTIKYAIAANNIAGPTANAIRMIEFDDAGATPSGQHGGGVCYAQTSAATSASTLATSWVFAMQGNDGTGSPSGFAGRFTFSGSGPLTMSNGEFDAASGITYKGNKTFSSGTIAAPDANGRSTASFVQNGKTINLVTYVVDANRAFTMTSDPYATNGLGSGQMYKQQQPSYSVANVTGGFVLSETGYDLDNTNAITGYFSEIFQGTGNGSGTATINASFMDEAPLNSKGTFTSGNANGPGTITATDSMGRMTVSTGYTPPGTTVLYFYNTNAAVMLDSGTHDGTNFSLGVGEVESQTGSSNFTDNAFAGGYLFGDSMPMSQYADDSSGVVTLNSSAAISGTNDNAGSGFTSYGETISANYSWESTNYGTIAVSQSGQQVLSCIAIQPFNTANKGGKFKCIENTSGNPKVMVFQP